jgi:hypothetical protein
MIKWLNIEKKIPVGLQCVKSWYPASPLWKLCVVFKICFKIPFYSPRKHVRGIRWHSWVRHLAISWKVVGLIPSHWDCSLTWSFSLYCGPAVDSAQPVAEVSTRSIRGDKGGRCWCVGLTNLPPCPKVLGASTSLNPKCLFSKNSNVVYVRISAVCVGYLVSWAFLQEEVRK